MNYGIQPECPIEVCGTAPECYTECEHTLGILQSTRFIGNQAHLISVLKGVLSTQEQYVKCLCDTDSIFNLGDIVGFPSIQCGYVVADKDCNCEDDYSDLFCNSEKTMILRCCGLETMCVCHINLDIRTTTIDFTSSAEGMELYTRIVTALIDFNGTASIGGIEEIAESILPESRVVQIIDGEIFLYVQNLTDFEWRSLPIIINALPVPIGMEINLVTKC